MSHSGWETKTVAESVPKELTVVGLISEEYVHKLEAQAAGMREALKMAVPYHQGGHSRVGRAIDKALSGDAGKEILEQARMNELNEEAIMEVRRHLEGVDIRADFADDCAAIAKNEIIGLRQERDRLKIEIELVRHERVEARADLDREQKTNLQERKELTELYAANMEVLKSQLETAQKELAELNNRDSEAKAECIRTMEKSIREFKTAQRQADWLLWASRRVRDGYPQEARGTYYEDLCTVIRVVESGLAGRDYVHRDELEKVNAELSDALRDAASHGNSNLRNRVAALLQRTMLGNGSRYVHRSEVSRAVEEEREACAKAAEDTCGCYTWCCSGSIAEAIRARGRG